jgi:hypothetical protein
VALAARTFFGALDDVMNAAAAKADTVRLGADESGLRLVHYAAFWGTDVRDPPLRFDVRSLPTALALRKVLSGDADPHVIRLGHVRPSSSTNWKNPFTSAPGVNPNSPNIAHAA